MANGTDESGFDQFLVAPRTGSADLSAFEDHLKSIPGAQILERGGRTNEPRLVINLPTRSFDELRSRFNDTLIIERNARLTPF